MTHTNAQINKEHIISCHFLQSLFGSATRREIYEKMKNKKSVEPIGFTNH